MGVFKRGKTYWYEFEFNGRRYRRSTKTGNQTVARQIEAARRTELAKGEAGIATPRRIPTFREFSQTFLATVETDAERPKTVKMYRTITGGLLAFPKLAEARVDAVDAALIDSYKQWKSREVSNHGKPFQPRTINLHLRVLRVILGKAHERDLIRKIPKVGRVGGEKPRDFILRDDSAYLEHASPDYRPMALLMLDAGLRVGEVLSLEWPQVRLGSKGGSVTITKAKAKGKRERMVPLTQRLREVLKTMEHGSGYVFHENGNPLGYATIRWQHAVARKAAGLPVECVPHSLRHTFGTRLGESGVDGFAIMMLMGHANIRETERYVHLGTDALERAIKQMDSQRSPQKSHHRRKNTTK